MKKFYLLCVVVWLSLFAGSNISFANNESVMAEKVWTIELTLPVLNEKENLNKIKIFNSQGQEVNVQIEVDRYNAKFLDVFAGNGFVDGAYELKVPAGFIAKSGEVTLEDYSKVFVVKGTLNHAYLNKEWSTDYRYKGVLYNVKAKFENGSVNLNVKDVKANMSYRGTEIYEIQDGKMLMFVDDLQLNLNGEIRYYNQNLFKIVTASGSYTYFEKVK